jgi:hypothetical protein
MEQAMLTLIIQYSKPMMLFPLIGSVIMLSHFGRRREFSARPREAGTKLFKYSRNCLTLWIPAFAGMSGMSWRPNIPLTPAKAGP